MRRANLGISSTSSWFKNVFVDTPKHRNVTACPACGSRCNQICQSRGQLELFPLSTLGHCDKATLKICSLDKGVLQEFVLQDVSSYRLLIQIQASQSARSLDSMLDKFGSEEILSWIPMPLADSQDLQVQGE